MFLKQAFLGYIIEYVHHQASSFKFGLNLPPSTILTGERGGGNNFCKFLIASFLKGPTLKGKRSKLFSFDSCSSLKREAKMTS